MRYGDEDGYNSIYDSSGDPILHGSETVLVSETMVIPTLKTTWRLYGGENLIEPSKGSLYLTNERMIFINAPERMMAIGGDHSRAMSSDMGSSFSFGEKGSDSTIREYFEIPNIEIMASEKKEGAVSVGEMVNVYILSSGNQFHLSFVLETESDLLKRLMNKQVSSSDELVKNLKEFFKNTDWMYLPMEKEIYSSEPEQAPVAPAVPKPVPQQKMTPKMAGRVQKNVTSKLHNKIESQSMKYFNNLYEKGLITEEIYNRLIQQYNGNSKGPVAPLSGSSPPKNAEVPPIQPFQIVEDVPEPGPIPEADAIPEAVPEPDPMPEDEPVPEAIPQGEPLSEPASEPVGDGSISPAQGQDPAASETQDESDDDLLGMLSDTLADMGDEVAPENVDQPAPEEEVPPKKTARKVKQMVVRQG